MEKFSISLHNGTKWSRQHNIRGAGLAEKEDHIDPNGYHVAFIDKSLRESYNETFGRSVLEYNSKQKRSDRMITDYLTKVKEEHKRTPSKKPHASYEMIVEVGNRDNHPSVKESQEVLKSWLDEFQKQNPNVVVFGAYFHADEPDAGPHMHVDYYFVKRENKRGMSLQVSQNGALNEQGYFPIKEQGKMVTPQTQFIRDSRELLREVAKEKGLSVDEQTKASAQRSHMETDHFKKVTKLKELDQKVTARQNQLAKLDKEKAKEQINYGLLKQKASKLDDKIRSVNEIVRDNEELKEENERLRERVSFLEKSINVLQRAFDFAERFLKRFNIGQSKQWDTYKKEFFDKEGKEEYDAFTSVRHDTRLNERYAEEQKRQRQQDWGR
jgi:hypothetical protein